MVDFDFRNCQKPKQYRSTKEGKAEFVKEILSPLMIHANTGWHGAEYEAEVGGEYVYLLDREGNSCRKIDVSSNSLSAIVTDVFKSID